MAIKIDGTNSQILFLAGTANTTTLKSSPTATPWTLTLPATPGLAGQVLTTDGSGNLSWTTGGGGGGGSPAGANRQIQFNNAGNFGADGGLSYPSTGTMALGLSGSATGVLRLVEQAAGLFVSIRPAVGTTSWTLTLPTTAGAAGQVLTTDGTGALSWSAGGGGSGLTITDDTATASDLYPTFTSATSGTITAANVSSTKLKYTPSTGDLSAVHMVASSGIFLNANTITASYTLPPGMNGLSAGPITVPGGVIVTAPPGQAWKVV